MKQRSAEQCARTARLGLLAGVLCAVAFLGSGSASRADADGLLEIGKPLPDIVLPSLDGGRPVRLSEYRGQKLILQIFASW